MQTTQPNSDQTKRSSKDDTNVFLRLATLPPGTDKNTLIETIDSAVDVVLAELAAHEEGDLEAETLFKVQTSLAFLEQCLAFKDQEFTSFAKKRANELQSALGNTIQRVEAARKRASTPVVPKIQVKEETPPAPEAESAPTATEATKPAATEEVPFDPKAFLYEREERILIDYAYKRLCKRLAFLRGDTIEVQNKKQVEISGIHDDGVPVFFLISPNFPAILREPFKDLIVEKRNLLSRRIYIHTDKDDTDEHVLSLYSETYHRDIDGIIALAFDDWSGEIAKAGVGGLPQEVQIRKPKEKEEQSGIGSSLKKVFSFGKKDEKKPVKAKTQKVTVPDTNAIRVHKEWQSLENKGEFNLSQHFSYSMISYAIQLNTKQFETEYECICQIVNQQDTPDVGPVVSNLSRLYKFYDNIFFDLVILVLYQRKNKFDINMLQAACMSQNFVVDRLPLTMDELRRRPMEHAKRILQVLKENEDKATVRTTLKDYFHVHETIHASKVGKRIQASENILKRQAEKAQGAEKKILDEILVLFREINNLKAQQEQDGTFLGEEIQDTIEEGIERCVNYLSA